LNVWGTRCSRRDVQAKRERGANRGNCSDELDHTALETDLQVEAAQEVQTK
jgi:hypothetical protein